MNYLIYLMTNITFGIDDEIHKKMKDHPEINWTEILRNSIIEYLKKIEETTVLSIEEFRNNLDQDTLKMIEALDEKDEIEFFQKIKQKEKERMELHKNINQD